MNTQIFSMLLLTFGNSSDSLHEIPNFILTLKQCNIVWQKKYEFNKKGENWKLVFIQQKKSRTYVKSWANRIIHLVLFTRIWFLSQENFAELVLHAINV